MSPENETGNIHISYSQLTVFPKHASSACSWQNDYATKKEAVLGIFRLWRLYGCLFCCQYASLTIWFIINGSARVNKNRYDLFQLMYIQIK